jgi:hypothetical protein
MGGGIPLENTRRENPKQYRENALPNTGGF